MKHHILNTFTLDRIGEKVKLKRGTPVFEEQANMSQARKIEALQRPAVGFGWLRMYGLSSERQSLETPPQSRDADGRLVRTIAAWAVVAEEVGLEVYL
ncbi:hypothetical protein SAMN05421665_1244 [Yoonia rosea]|uniref:Uncharacterized protein n=1 Tax=Yoonia rosea TaxID=287098 RepID=A0A1R3WUJ6_9RHOB|nr:hypothetical protein [Yoonia rosea]SIT81268.1 hypothetical protein SAMN05421665_1244 [Yoonia rosea]